MLSCALLDSAQQAVLPAVNQFPAEEVRRALGDRIQLTENQVQVRHWIQVCSTLLM